MALLVVVAVVAMYIRSGYFGNALQEYIGLIGKGDLAIAHQMTCAESQEKTSEARFEADVSAVVREFGRIVENDALRGERGEGSTLISTDRGSFLARTRMVKEHGSWTPCPTETPLGKIERGHSLGAA